MSKKQGTRHGRGFWAPVIAQFEAEPQQHEAFAVSRGLNVDTFRRWLYRLRRERPKSAGRFEVVRATPVAVSARAACIVEVGTARVLFEQTPDPEYLARLLAATGT
jgi:hypothetical protein